MAISTLLHIYLYVQRPQNRSLFYILLISGRMHNLVRSTVLSRPKFSRPKSSNPRVMITCHFVIKTPIWNSQLSTKFYSQDCFQLSSRRYFLRNRFPEELKMVSFEFNGRKVDILTTCLLRSFVNLHKRRYLATLKYDRSFRSISTLFKSIYASPGWEDKLHPRPR